MRQHKNMIGINSFNDLKRPINLTSIAVHMILLATF